jgi:hypothetical protein
MPPFGEYRALGRVVAHESEGWRIEDDQGRTRFAQTAPSSLDIDVGDRVEIEPMFQSSAGTRLTNTLWTIVRKLD